MTYGEVQRLKKRKNWTSKIDLSPMNSEKTKMHCWLVHVEISQSKYMVFEVYEVKKFWHRSP